MAGISRKDRSTDEQGAGRGWRRFVWPSIGVFAVGLAAFLLYRTLRQYTFAEIIASVRGAPGEHVIGGLAFAAASYFCLTWFDWLATRYAGHPMPWRRAAHASFVALSLGHNIGFAALSSGAIRYRFYIRWGMSGEGVAKVIAFCGATVGLGLGALIGVASLLRPQAAMGVTGLSASLVFVLGLGALAACGLWLLCSAFVRRPVRIRSWTIAFPPLRLAIGQMIVGPLNFACVAGCLHQAILVAAEVDYAAVATAYVLANAAALLSHVPGGLGVIESVVIFLFPGAQLIGALLIFRFTYFIAPLAVGLVALAATEAWWRRGKRPANYKAKGGA